MKANPFNFLVNESIGRWISVRGPSNNNHFELHVSKMVNNIEVCQQLHTLHAPQQFFFYNDYKNFLNSLINTGDESKPLVDLALPFQVIYYVFFF